MITAPVPGRTAVILLDQVSGRPTPADGSTGRARIA